MKYCTQIAIILIVTLATVFMLQSCGSKEKPKPAPTTKGRWFTQSQFELGNQVYSENCAHCHGQYGQSIVDNWKKPNPDGSFPPPPLNGTAHTWHHPFEVLIKTINEGGEPVGGVMPAFGDSLREEEKVAVIAYIQSLWSQEVYERWVKMNASQ